MGKKKKKKNPGGRPSKMTSEIVGKLEAAWSRGASDKLACSFAGINPDTLYEYLKRFPKYTERRDQLKSNLVMKALDNVQNGLIKGDLDLSRWYLERRCRDEFSTRQEFAGVADKPLVNPDLALAASRLANMSEEQREARMAQLKTAKEK